MICSHCGTNIQEGDKFCSNCGAPVEPQQTYQTSQQSQQQTYQQYQSYTQYGQNYTEPGTPVGFVDAIKMFFTKYADFNTRSGRSEYWFAILFLVLVNMALSFLIREFGIFGWLSGLWSMIILIPSISLSVRRLHDIGKNGVYLLWVLLPLAGYIIILVQCCKESAPANQWGPNPNGN